MFPLLESVIDSNDTIFKYNRKQNAYSAIKAEYIMKKKFILHTLIKGSAKGGLTAGPVRVLFDGIEVYLGQRAKAAFAFKKGVLLGEEGARVKKYAIAIYIRLSKEDDKWKEESNSITMQRALLKKYAAENFADYELMEFCDDGYTGTNLNRPGMQEMLCRIREGEIKCVIVKDFSRFARDYVELGTYLEQIFPFLGVRFISVNDGYDSSHYQGSVADIDVNFKNLLYDLYSKDLSEKVRSSLAIRKEKGQYVSGNSPFGYEKDTEDRHALLVAEDEAEVVRRIFSLTLNGWTSVQIAKLFNKEGVKTPVEFKIEKGKTSRIPKGEKFLWGSSTICQILRNEIYIGNIVQKKYGKDFVGEKNHIKPRKEWLVSYGHHEPIIDKKDFDKVQEGRGNNRRHASHPVLLPGKSSSQHNWKHPLVGKLICGGCKRNLRYRRGLNPYFTCHNRYSNAMKNCIIKVNAAFMEQYILWMMQDRLGKEGGLEKPSMGKTEMLAGEIRELKEKRKFLLAKMERLKQQNFEAYQNYACGRAGSFRSCGHELKSVKEELDGLDDNIQKMEAAYSGMEYNREAEYAGNWFAELSEEMVESYIDKIEVYDEQHIKIRWKENAV